MNKHQIVFIGSSTIGLKLLNEDLRFNVVNILCMKERIDPSLLHLANKLSIPLKVFINVQNFANIIANYSQNSSFFIYQLDMLVPETLTKKYRFFNLHRGDLLTNRGPRPEIRSILNGDSSSSLSLHKIDEKIDQGTFIDKYETNITKNDTPASLKNKLEKGIPLMINSLHLYLRGKLPGKKLSAGIYYPWVNEKDFTIDLKSDSLEIISRKIRSQKAYNGAIIIRNGIKYYLKDYFLSENIGSSAGETLSFKVKGKTINFIINSKPKYKLPPVRLPSKRI